MDPVEVGRRDMQGCEVLAKTMALERKEAKHLVSRLSHELTVKIF